MMNYNIQKTNTKTVQTERNSVCTDNIVMRLKLRTTSTSE